MKIAFKITSQRLLKVTRMGDVLKSIPNLFKINKNIYQMSSDSLVYQYNIYILSTIFFKYLKRSVLELIKNITSGEIR